MESDPGPGDGPGGSGPGGSGVGGGEGGTDPNDDPCNGNGVLTNPQQPGLTDPNGCTGIPTMPTLPIRNNPCEKIKTQNSNITYKSKIDFLKEKTNETFEYGFRVGSPTAGTGQTEVLYQQLSNVVGSQTLDFKIFNKTFAMIHSHHEALVPVFSPDDINSFIKLLINASNNGIPLSSVYMTLVNPDGTVYQLWGSNDVDVSSLTIFDQNTIDNELNKKYINDYDLAKANQAPEFYQKNFLKFMRDNMNVSSAKMYSVNSDGKGSQLSLNGNSLANPIPCP